MYLKQINIENYGAIEKLGITPNFNENDAPHPIVLVGKNGSGKTLLLANIADSLIEAKRQCYSKLQEANIDKFFKLGKKDYVFSSKDYYHINLKFQIEDLTENYTDFVTLLEKDSFIAKYNEIEFDGLIKNDERFQKTGFYKNFSAQNIEKLKNDFDKNTYIYFPHSRYDIPAWLNEVEMGFNFSANFVGESITNIVKSYIIPDIQRWILDIILDKELYEKVNIPLSVLQNIHPYSLLQNPKGIELNITWSVQPPFVTPQRWRVSCGFPSLT